jgi:hypothetical protein
VTRLRAGRPWFAYWRRGRSSSLRHRVNKGSGVHKASYPMGTAGYFPRVKRPGREANHSPPSSAEVKSVWPYTSNPPFVFMAWCLVKHRDNFTFTLPSLNGFHNHMEVKIFRYSHKNTDVSSTCIFLWCFLNWTQSSTHFLP